MAVIYRIGEFNIYTHGIFAVAGIIAASIVIYLFAKKELDCAFLFDNIVYSILAGIIGARLGFFLLYRDQFASFKEIVFLWQGGLVSYTGFITGIIALIVLLKFQRQPVMKWLDLFSLGFPLGLAVGRIGEVIAGENFSDPGVVGVETNRFASVNFYEAIWCLIIFIIVLVWQVKSKKKKGSGHLFFATILLYTGGRFIVDFWRISDKIFLSFSLSQLASFVFFGVALAAVLTAKKLKQKG